MNGYSTDFLLCFFFFYFVFAFLFIHYPKGAPSQDNIWNSFPNGTQVRGIVCLNNAAVVATNGGIYMYFYFSGSSFQTTSRIILSGYTGIRGIATDFGLLVAPLLSLSFVSLLAIVFL